MNDSARRQRWEQTTLSAGLKEAPERRTTFVTTSQIEIARLYTDEDLPAHHEQRLGLPGEYPFTRGVQPTMYRSRFWTMRQYAGFGTAEESNARYRALLNSGQTGLSVAFDLPTQMGYDSDNPIAEGEVGKVGVAIDSLRDMEVLLNELPLGEISTSMTINAPASILLALYVAVARQRGIDPRALRGTIQNDVLKEYIARGTYIFPPRHSLRLVTDIFSWCAAEVPKWNTISISGYHIREAGSTAVQEIAFTLANGIAYLEAARAAGLPLERVAPRLSFFFNAQINLFEEAAKFRAARRLWARILADRYAVSDPSLGKLRFHTQTAGVSLTAQQPENNIVRTTVEALAAVLGGTQSLHTNALDEALGLPTEHSARIALRTQQILAYETGVGDTVDPLAGSYFVEALTDQLERQAEALISKIEALGGAVAAIEQNFPQREIAESAYRWQRAVETKDQIVVGVNQFTVESEPPTPVQRISEELRARQCARTALVRSQRDDTRWNDALAALERSARDGSNLMPPILAAVEAFATVGEISERLCSVFGRYEPEGF